VQHLASTDKRAAKATHNIAAWRIRGPPDSGTRFQDYDDDGETAGGRLLHLLQLMDAWDVVVVVSRWYGGVQLGPDRFRIINGVARAALILGGFVADKGEKEGGKKEGGR
jgi:putative IMPACT (imprinted ancient) family translation regulator